MLKFTFTAKIFKINFFRVILLSAVNKTSYLSPTLNIFSPSMTLSS